MTINISNSGRTLQKYCINQAFKYIEISNHGDYILNKCPYKILNYVSYICFWHHPPHLTKVFLVSIYNRDLL